MTDTYATERRLRLIADGLIAEADKLAAARRREVAQAAPPPLPPLDDEVDHGYAADPPSRHDDLAPVVLAEREVPYTGRCPRCSHPTTDGRCDACRLTVLPALERPEAVGVPRCGYESPYLTASCPLPAGHFPATPHDMRGLA